MKLSRYWFEMNPDFTLPFHNIYFGVTAWTYEDAIFLLKSVIFKTDGLPPIKLTVENVDVSTLDTNHVVMNVGVPTFRGIWSLKGY